MRRSHIPRPAGAHPAGVIPPEQFGKFPIPAGGIVMTEHTRQELRKLGWKDGDPLPDDFGQHVVEFKKQYQADLEKAAAGQAGLAAKPTDIRQISIDDLPAKDQAELRQYLAQHKATIEQHVALQENQLREHAEIDAAVAGGNMSPNVAQSLKQSATEFAVVMDPPSGAAPSAPPPQPTGASPASPPPPPPPENDQKPSTGANTPAPPAFCPRCHWDQSLPVTVVPTREDIESFIPSFLSLGVFRKTYQILNGQFAVTFRGNTAPESIAIYNQLGLDLRAQRIAGELEWLSALYNYRLVLSVETITVGGNIIHRPPSMAEYMARHPDVVRNLSPDKETILPRMRDDFYAQFVPTVTLQRILSQLHREFVSLLENMEAQVSDPNFSKGIVLPR